MSREWKEGSEPLPGYRLIRYLGEGGSGEVWKAEKTSPGGKHCEVALKRINVTMKLGPREKKALEYAKQFRHANLLPIHDSWEHGDYLIVAMELANGTLLDRVRDYPRGIPPQQLASHMLDAGLGIDILNSHDKPFGNEFPFLHRDIKPENLMLVADRVKVGDFGLLIPLEHTGEQHSGVGTLPYAPPEWLRHDPKMSGRSDQYSFALTYYVLRTGLDLTKPLNELMKDLLKKLWKSPQAHARLDRDPDLAALPADEQKVVGKALSRHPKDRYRSCVEFVNHLLTCGAFRGALPPTEDDLRRTSVVPILDFVAPPEERGSGAAAAGPMGKLVNVPARPTGRCNLPPAPHLVGRSEMVADLRQRIRTGGVIVLKGEGGIGKTALARAAANAAFAAGEVPGGAVFVDCERGPTRQTCLREIAKGLFGDRMEAKSIDECQCQIEGHFRTNKTLVLVDNFETVTKDTELRQWFAAVPPPSAVLITSRTDAVDLDWQLIEVRELELHDAVELFLAKTRNKEGAALQIDAVRELCAAVYGLPLAIELLAKLRVSPKDLLRTLQDGLEPLEAKDGNDCARHRSINECFALSYKALRRRARALLARLAVLAGDVGGEVVAALAGKTAWLHTADELVASSVCRQERNRYTMHGLMRRFVLEKVRKQRKDLEVHVSKVLAKLVKEKGEQSEAEDSATSFAAFDWLEQEWPNITTCAASTLNSGEWQITAAIADSVREFFLNRGHLHDCADLLRRVSAARQAGNDLIGAAVSLFNLGTVQKYLGQLAEAESIHRQSLGIRREHGLPKELAESLNGLGDVLRMQGRRDEATKLLAEGRQIFQGIDDKKGEVQCLLNLAMCYDDDPKMQEEAFGQCLKISQETQYTRGEAYSHRSLARLFQSQQRWQDAIDHYDKSLAKFRQAKNQAGEGETLSNYAECWLVRGDLCRAREQIVMAIGVLKLAESRHLLQAAERVLATIEMLTELESVQKLDREGAYSEAFVLCDKLVQAHSASYLARRERAKLLSLLGRFTEADKDFSACRSVNPLDFDLVLETGFNAWRDGRFEEAVDDFRLARSRGIDVLQTILFECIYFIRIGRKEEIASIVAQTAERHRQNPDLASTVRWIAGDISDEQLLADATTSKRRCGVLYWIGEKARAHGDVARGNKQIADCIATQATTHYEYQHAVALKNGGRL